MSIWVHRIKLVYSRALRTALIGPAARMAVRGAKNAPERLKPVYGRILQVPVVGSAARTAVRVSKPSLSQVYHSLFASIPEPENSLKLKKPLSEWQRIERLENEVAILKATVRNLTDIIDLHLAGESVQAKRVDKRLSETASMIKRLEAMSFEAMPDQIQ